MIPLVLAPSGCLPDTVSGRKSAEWECSLHCKPLTDVEIVAIVTLRAAFEGSIEEARQALAECDFGLALSPGSPLTRAQMTFVPEQNLRRGRAWFAKSQCMG